jgi:catechol 2,3-dioxygenase-like lactoylglutathione lyase family enzyme
VVRPPIQHQTTFLYTRDLTATARFYEEVMGLQLALDQQDCRIYRVAEAAFLGFCEREDAPDHPGGIILTIITKEVDRWYAYLRDQGVAFEKEPSYNPRYDIYHCFLRDPNGYLVEIQRFEDPAWDARATRALVN